MTRPFIRLATLACGLTLAAACQALPGSLEPTGATSESTGLLTGTVRLPARQVFTGLPVPGSTAPPSPGTGPERAAAGAEVFCADARGTRVPGVPASFANAEGRFALGGVPLGYAYLVTAVYRDAAARPVRLRTLTRSQDGTTEVMIDTASTLLVSAAVPPGAGLVTAYPLEAWARALKQLTAGLATGELPDLGDPVATADAVTRLLAADTALATDVASIRRALEQDPGAAEAPTPVPAATTTP